MSCWVSKLQQRWYEPPSKHSTTLTGTLQAPSVVQSFPWQTQNGLGPVFLYFHYLFLFKKSSHQTGDKTEADLIFLSRLVLVRTQQCWVSLLVYYKKMLFKCCFVGGFLCKCLFCSSLTLHLNFKGRYQDIRARNKLKITLKNQLMVTEENLDL